MKHFIFVLMKVKLKLYFHFFPSHSASKSARQFVIKNLSEFFFETFPHIEMSDGWKEKLLWLMLCNAKLCLFVK
jgi:hypothetical protein